MNNEVLIRAEGVSKKFCRNLKKSLLYGGSDIIKGFLGVERTEALRKGEFWAVSNASFEVKRGECLALIGHNGAGKSTLLKMLNGLIRPDKGRIEMHGKVGALIELGAGFSPLLTGRQNVYNNGAVLGFTKQEIDQKFDEIVEFAELQDFIDSPVQNYSSGMKVRLGFAVAAQLEPDILLIDEVLAVGDLGFQAKCFNKISDLVNKCAIIFVSHSMPLVAPIATEVIHLDKGEIIYQGRDVGEGIETYYKKFDTDISQFVGAPDSVVINKFEFIADENIMRNNCDVKQFADIRMNILYKVNESLKYRKHGLVFTIYDQALRGVVMINSDIALKGPLAIDCNTISATIEFKNILAPGKYTIWIYFNGAEGLNDKYFFGYATYQAFFTINVIGGMVYSVVPVHMTADWRLNI